MPDDTPGPVQFPPFDPERVEAAFAEHARNDALSCKECHGSGMTKVMRCTSACPACKGTGRIPPAPDAPAARQRFPDAFAFRSACCQGEKCLRCGAPADGKIEEVIFDDDPVQMRHPFTAYLCKAHLRETLIAAFGKGEISNHG